MQRVAVAGPAGFGAVLELRLDLRQRLRIDQLAQLLLAEQLPQQLAVQGQRRRPALGVRRVALVHVGRDVVEQQRGGERGGGLGLDLDQGQPPRVQVGEQRRQRGQVEDVAQALAVGLEDDREAGEVLGDLEQALRLQALLPQRCPLAWIGTRDQQRSGGVLPEPSAEQRRSRQLGDDQVLQLVGFDQHQVGRRGLVGIGKVDDDAVVGPDRVDLQVALGADLLRERQAPGRVDPAAVGREDADPPVSDLVPEALDDDRLVGGDDAGRRLLLLQIGDEVGSRPAVEVVLARQHLRVGGYGLAGEGADRLAELGRAPDSVTAPERDRAGDPRGGGDDHPVAGDVLDPPGRGAEQERLPRPCLVDHLLVELADPAPVGEVDPVEAAIGDRAGVGDRQLAGALAAVDRAAGPVPDDPRPQLREAVRGVAAVEHVEHVLELLAREIRERLGGGDQALDLVDLPLVERRHRDEVLGEHVEGVLGDHRLLDLPLAHPPRDHRALQQVGAELREHAALGDLAEAVAGAADPLQPAGHRLRRLDLDDEVDRAHVDPQLQRRGRDQAGQLARLQQLLDVGALLVRQRAVVGAGDLDEVAIRLTQVVISRMFSGGELLPGLLVRHLVEALGEAFGAAAVVDEDDRRGVLADQLQQLRVDRGPDRSRVRLRIEVRVGVDAVARTDFMHFAGGSVADRFRRPWTRGESPVRSILGRESRAEATQRF